ncbi:glycine cleavage system transcriptional repressor [Pseudomonas aeruginosa]|nr:glycine cleavage system transcriptional repressor [Pseudomonas aeruginosa]
MLQVSGSWDALARLEGSLPTLTKRGDITLSMTRSNAHVTRAQALPYVAYVSAVYRPDILNELCQFFIDHNHRAGEPHLRHLPGAAHQHPPCSTPRSP